MSVQIENGANSGHHAFPLPVGPYTPKLFAEVDPNVGLENDHLE